MSKEEFKNVIGKLQVAYNKIFTQEENRMWFSEFQNIPKEEFETAINQLIHKNIFMPRISEVRNKIIENSNRYYSDDSYRHLYKNSEWGEFAS